jgi:uncharacterized RDD family membrane protein YckC
MAKSKVLPMDETPVRYAGFWLRFFAAFLDMVIVPTLLLLIVIFIALIWSIVGMFVTTTGLVLPHVTVTFAGMGIALISMSILILSFLYEPLMLSSRYQATIGMMMLSLKIVDIDMKPIGFGTAFLRMLCEYLSSALFFIGYIMIAFTPRKQGLHDKIMDTYILRI